MIESKQFLDYTQSAWERRRAVLLEAAEQQTAGTQTVGTHIAVGADRVLAECGEEEAVLLKYVLATLPLPDLGDYSPSFFLQFVRHALRVRGEFSWCAALPEHRFLLDVLYPRINTEELADCRGLFYEALAPRVRGLSAEEAILEVNRWCAEEATYRSTDDRTASPLAVYRCGWGRCGEESTFTVTALRSVGIAARQVYAPRWSHCDDNHAWVEAFDGERWRFFGACEPEPLLDRGWFTGAASRAMLVHARAFVQGSREEVSFLFPEMDPLDLELRQGVAYETVTARYADTAKAAVTVRRVDGTPVPGARVSFSILNMAEFSEIAAGWTDNSGSLTQRLGKGSVRVTAVGEDCFAEALLDTSREDSLCLTLDMAERTGESGWEPFDFLAPADAPKFSASLPPELKRERRECLDRTAALREAKMARLAGAPGAGRTEELERILRTLTEKDRAGGVPEEVLADAAAAYALEQEFPAEVFEGALLSPRIGLEPLAPWREKLVSALTEEERKLFRREPARLWAWMEGRVREEPESYAELCGTPAGALALGAAIPAGRNNLFCALCRSDGVPARLSPADGEPEYYDRGAFRRLCGGETAGGGELTAGRGAVVRLCAPVEQAGLFRQNYTLSRRTAEGDQTLSTGDVPAGGTLELPLAAGSYRVLTVSRMPNGNQFAQRLDFDLGAGERREIRLSFREGKASDMLERCTLPSFLLKGLEGETVESGALLKESRYSLLFWLEVSREPTEHICNELREAAEKFRQTHCPLHLVLEGPEDLTDPTLQRTLKALPGVRLWYGDFLDTAPALARRMYVDPERLPLVLLADDRGDGLYGCSGYNVGTAELLLRLLAELSAR